MAFYCAFYTVLTVQTQNVRCRQVEQDPGTKDQTGTRAWNKTTRQVEQPEQDGRLLFHPWITKKPNKFKGFKAYWNNWNNWNKDLLK